MDQNFFNALDKIKPEGKYKRCISSQKDEKLKKTKIVPLRLLLEEKICK